MYRHPVLGILPLSLLLRLLDSLYLFIERTDSADRIGRSAPSDYISSHSLVLLNWTVKPVMVHGPDWTRWDYWQRWRRRIYRYNFSFF